MYFQATISSVVKTIFFGILFSVALVSCDNDDDINLEIITTGVLQSQGITTYQYGTHVMNEFALRSDIDLDQYIGQTVTVFGNKIAGYPVDGGPDYLEVRKVEVVSSDITASGTLETQGITTYQYGTHVIGNYALRSNTIDLTSFVDQSVTIIGRKIDGYPLSGGPDYLEVIEVK